MWLLQRAMVSVLLIWAVASIVFFAIHLVPGDPAEILLSQGGAAPTQAMTDNLRVKLGLDRPIGEQYLGFLGGALAGDLGRSLVDGVPVMSEIARRLPRTLELIGAAALMSLLVGVPAGLWSALGQGRAFDNALRAVAGISLAMPVFVVGTLLVLVLAQYLRLLPAGGFVPFERDPAQHFLLLFSPALAITVGLWAMVFRITRASVLDVLSRDYIRVARAKGLPVRNILASFVLRNAAAPILTVTALEIGSLLGGTVLVEYVFNWPGLSGLLVEAVNARDYPMVVGVVLVIAVLFIAISFVVDMLYHWLDPRVRLA